MKKCEYEQENGFNSIQLLKMYNLYENEDQYDMKRPTFYFPS